MKSGSDGLAQEKLDHSVWSYSLTFDRAGIKILKGDEFLLPLDTNRLEVLKKLFNEFLKCDEFIGEILEIFTPETTFYSTLNIDANKIQLVESQIYLN